MTGRSDSDTIHHYLHPRGPMTHDEMTARMKELRRLPKEELITRLVWREDTAVANDRAARDAHAQLYESCKQRDALKASLAELEKVQQDLVARLERAYEAVVKATLR